jgi:hypothetical protein
VPHRATRRALLLAALAALAALSAACASPDADPRERTASAPSSVPDAEPVAAPAGAVPSLPTSVGGIKAGWISFKAPTKRGQVTNLTLCGASSEEGKLISRGARMDGGKVVDDRTADNLSLAYTEAGFERFAVKRRPTEPPAGALGAVWIERGNGFETLFLMPGARQNPATEDLPDVYDGLKKLILSVHMSTPGSMVVTGEGWSGDDMLRQRPGSGGR